MPSKYRRSIKKRETIQVTVPDNSKPWASGDSGALPTVQITLPRAPWDTPPPDNRSTP